MAPAKSVRRPKPSPQAVKRATSILFWKPLEASVELKGTEVKSLRAMKPTRGRRAAPCTDSQWNCRQRRPAIMNMALFHNRTEGQPVSNWWDNGNNQIAFSRGDKGFVAINGKERQPGGLGADRPAGRSTATCWGAMTTAAAVGHHRRWRRQGQPERPRHEGGRHHRRLHQGQPGSVLPGNKFSSMNLRGTHNAWGNTPMTVDANRVWSATLCTLTGNGDATGAQRFKFGVFGNWAENYGDNEGGPASPTRAAAGYPGQRGGHLPHHPERE